MKEVTPIDGLIIITLVCLLIGIVLANQAANKQKKGKEPNCEQYKKDILEKNIPVYCKILWGKESSKN